jgi:hypothetical protein
MKGIMQPEEVRISKKSSEYRHSASNAKVKDETKGPRRHRISGGLSDQAPQL